MMIQFQGENESGICWRNKEEVHEDGYCLLFYKTCKNQDDLEKYKEFCVPIFIDARDVKKGKWDIDIVNFGIKKLEESVSHFFSKK